MKLSVICSARSDMMSTMVVERCEKSLVTLASRSCIISARFDDSTSNSSAM